MRRVGQPENTALVLQNIWDITWFAGSLLATLLRAVLWQDLLNWSLSTNVKQQHQLSKEHWLLLVRKCSVPGDVKINEVKIYEIVTFSW